PGRASRMVAISPFLDRSLLGRLPASRERTLVSRPETLNRLGSAALQGWTTATLARTAERPPDEHDGSAPADGTNHHGDDDDNAAAHERDRIRDGLHAKTIVADVTGESLTLTGSANLTSPAWGGNVEL